MCLVVFLQILTRFGILQCFPAEGNSVTPCELFDVPRQTELARRGVH